MWRRLQTSRPKSLFGQIMLWMLLPLIILWPLSMLISYPIGRSIADSPFDQSLNNQIQLLQQRVHTEQVGTPWHVVADDGTDKRVFQLITADGVSIEGWAKLPQPPLLDSIELNRVQFYNTKIDGEPYRMAYVWLQLNAHSPLTVKFSPDTLVLLQIGETLNKRRALARQILQGVTLPQLMFLPIAVMLIWFGLTRGIMSLNRLQMSVLQRNENDLSNLSLDDTPEEVQPLVRSFNNILSRLRRNVGLQKRFLADTAHQIKTPLAGLKAQAELALNTKSSLQRRESLEHISSSADRAARLVSQLIALARTEHISNEGTDWKNVDLVQAARDQLVNAADHAMQAGLLIAFEAPDWEVPVFAQPVMLGELIKNLIDNACHYTQSDVTVRVTQDHLAAHLYVLDNGPGIPAHEREQVFEPFYSVLGENKGGSGLGLAIVKEIARLHSAELKITENVELENAYLKPGCIVHVIFKRADVHMSDSTGLGT